jgi:hypothetical protein
MTDLAIHRCRWLLRLCALSLALVILSSCRPGPEAFRWSANNADWHEFQGTWTATGTRNILHLEGDRRASIGTFNGSLVLAGESRPGIGFRSEAIVFTDNVTGLMGRAVWTDEHGDQVFSELRGEGTAARNKITGTIVGGTGRYAGANGSYEFSWKFVLEDEGGTVQGQSVGLTGRVRVGSKEASSRLGGPQS